MKSDPGKASPKHKPVKLKAVHKIRKGFKLFFKSKLNKLHSSKKLDLKDFRAESNELKSTNTTPIIEHDRLTRIDQACDDNKISVNYDEAAYEKSVEKVETVKKAMMQNIEKLIERDANLSDLQQKACNLNMNILDLQITTHKIKQQTLTTKKYLIVCLASFVLFLAVLAVFSVYSRFGKDNSSH